jgi:hypothetical protein
MADHIEAQFNALMKGVTKAGVIPTRLDWFTAGYHHANQSRKPYCWISRGGGLPQVLFEEPREIQAHAWMPLYSADGVTGEVPKQADCKCPQGMYCRHRARIEGNSEGTGTNGVTACSVDADAEAIRAAMASAIQRFGAGRLARALAEVDKEQHLQTLADGVQGASATERVQVGRLVFPGASDEFAEPEIDAFMGRIEAVQERLQKTGARIELQVFVEVPPCGVALPPGGQR